MRDVRALASTEEVAEYLGLPPRTLERWRYIGKGPRWASMGRHVRYSWSDIEAWVAEQTTNSAA